MSFDCFFKASTTSATTILPPVQVESSRDIIKHCQQPIIIDTLASAVLVGAISAVVFGIVFPKLTASALKSSNIPNRNN
jgi:hypothetical protein